MGACYSPERDLLQDPYNSPLIHILDSDFVPSSGQVALRFEYLGSDPILRVVIRRRAGFTFDSIGVVTNPTQISEGRLIDAFSDPDPPAGELLEYTVTGITPLSRVNARAVQVQIPGARILRLRRNPFEARIQVDWESIGSQVSAFEVIREAGGVESTLTVTGPDIESYVDLDIRGNTTYSYRVLSRVTGGAVLSSEVLSAGVYSSVRTENVASSSDHVALATGSASSSVTLHALIAQPGFVDISKYRYFFGTSGTGQQTVSSIREETVPTDLFDIDPASLDIAGPSPFLSVSADERLFIAGKTKDGSTVTIRALDLPNLTTEWRGPVAWGLADPSARVSVDQGPDTNIYFTAGGSLRIYSSTLFEIGTHALPFDDPVDLVSNRDWLFALIPGGRLMRTSIDAFPTQASWEEVDLGSRITSPVAVAVNRVGQLVVLDSVTGTLTVYDTDLNEVLYWDLPDDGYSDGHLALDGGTGNLIHVSSSAGNVYTYLP